MPFVGTFFFTHSAKIFIVLWSHLNRIVLDSKHEVYILVCETILSLYIILSEFEYGQSWRGENKVILRICPMLKVKTQAQCHSDVFYC